MILKHSENNYRVQQNKAVEQHKATRWEKKERGNAKKGEKKRENKERHGEETKITIQRAKKGGKNSENLQLWQPGYDQHLDHS